MGVHFQFNMVAQHSFNYTLNHSGTKIVSLNPTVWQPTLANINSGMLACIQLHCTVAKGIENA